MGYYDEKKQALEVLLNEFREAKAFLEKELVNIGNEKENNEENKKIVGQLAKERQIGFPTLAKAYEEYFKLQDQQIIDFLKYKDKPAVKASEILSEFAQMRRKAVSEKKIAEYIVSYYESICPFLIDLKEEISDITEGEKELLADYTNEEIEDETTKYLTKEEYRKLSITERNQLALDRYWKRPKSKWHIGKIYERYIGYLYEEMGYDVEFHGIFKGLEDLGRDLLGKKNKEIIVIQCKYWSAFRTIYEKHIFQFFGTVFQYKDENRDKDVKALFYTTTNVSDLARRFAQELGIDLKENYKMQYGYPCIKCNISMVNGTKIYHLPFDQQYDKVKITKTKGEFYCKTVADAEKAGFRRAFKWHPDYQEGKK